MSVRELKICPQRAALLECDTHMLVLGGPGSGKTTIALVKASTDLVSDILSPGQKILFLSFARATVNRVMQEAAQRIPKESMANIEISTYHGFAWNFIQANSYLLTGRRRLKLLSPPEEAACMAGTDRTDRPARLRRFFDEDGLLAFDLFAGLTADLLERSPRLGTLLGDCYPIVMLDEFQDTNRDEWRMISAFGKRSRLMALADAEQRIYEFRGADPARIGEFLTAFEPTVFDFGQENNRSDGTDIAVFGNDLLTGANVNRTYRDVKLTRYNPFAGDPLSAIKYALFASMQRLISDGQEDWSIGVLVSSKTMMLKVSAFLATASNGLREVAHEALLDPEGPALAAVLIAGLLQGGTSSVEIARRLIEDMIGHIRGRKGGDISQADLAVSDALQQYLVTGRIRGSARQELVHSLQTIATKRAAMPLSGDPTADWLSIRKLLDDVAHEKIASVAEDARFVRLLNRGTLLRDLLSEQWRASGSYNGARQMVADALLQEYFSNSTRPWRGVNVMTIHKSKGKDFDEVIIYEGSHSGRLLRANANARDVEQAKLTLRVGVTRARKKTTILIPSRDGCRLL